ncbi:hypothetical protein EJ03DRAFT_323169 [Teratosphaeria nubilosa]|uniref:CCHC-type domain-containing protein n=1 Tax=Teratosphaeria nubilosa TaxID=161662 RepID=A0A6G1LLK7_9PEZI|nr:hypothetical protein EJ03DRAFT_323169 [Teratosphaeria nubilosa]
MSGSGNIDNIIENPSASAAHQKARNLGQSFVMDEPEESRTAALGRKRKKGGDLHSQLAADKRRRLSAGDRSDGDDDWADDSMSISERSSNHGSKESGEVSSGDDEQDDYARASSSNAQISSTKPRASHISISSDDNDVTIIPPPASAKAKRPYTLTLDQVQPAPFRKFIEKEMQNYGEGASVEAIVRLIIRRGKGYVKPARKFIAEWDAMIQANSQESQAYRFVPPQDVNGIQKAFQKGLFSRAMGPMDMMHKPGLRKHLESLGTKPIDILPTLCKIANHGAAFCTQAKAVLCDFSMVNYIGSDTSAPTAGASVQKDRKQTKPERTMSARPRQSVVFEAPSVGEAPDAEMEDQVPALNHDNEESSDDDPSVGDSPMRESHDYGSLARDAAGFTPLNGRDPPPLVHMHDISEEEQLLQYRYYRISQPDDLVRCLYCGELGHIEDDCPEHICRHCGVYGDHFSYNCPKYSKCSRCRQRGHATSTCRNRLAQPGGKNDPCDVCGRVGHIEEECARLWCSFTIKDEKIVKVPESQITKACYNCGRSDHFGDDCPRLPDYARGSQDGRVWSDSNAKRFAQVEQEPARQYSNGHSYQMAQLDDMRD